jgi:hypothetical protein
MGADLGAVHAADERSKAILADLGENLVDGFRAIALARLALHFAG